MKSVNRLIESMVQVPSFMSTPILFGASSHCLKVFFYVYGICPFRDVFWFLSIGHVFGSKHCVAYKASFT